MRDLFTRYGGPLAAGFMALTAFWLLALVILPYLYLFENSFRPYLPVAEMGGPKDFYSLNNYLTFFQSSDPYPRLLRDDPLQQPGHDPLLLHRLSAGLLSVQGRQAARSCPRCSCCFSSRSGSARSCAPSPGSSSWRSRGPLNFGLIGLGIIETPIRWLSGFRSIVIGLVYTYVLFMLFPLYNAVQSLDTNQIEAAQDLGSPWWRIHWRVILPHSKPGIASGAVMVFMLSAGSILVPTLLASTTSRWFTEIIQQWMFESQDWNTGSAYAFLLLLLCTVFVTVVMRIFRVSLVGYREVTRP